MTQLPAAQSPGQLAPHHAVRGALRPRSESAILSRVCDTMNEAGLDDQVDEFLKRALVCRSAGEMVQLAMEYVAFNE